MERRVITALTAIGALVAAGCSSSSSGATSSASTSSASAATTLCVATIGMEGPLTGPTAVVGQEQLHFAELALTSDNLANETNITLVQGDILGPAQAVTVTQGECPTFFLTVSKDSVQGPQGANYIVKTLHPKALMIVDDHEAYSTGLVSAMTPIFQAAGIKVDHESVSQKVTDFSSLVAKVTPETSVVVLPWQVAANAQQFGRNLAQQHKTAVIFGTDGLFSPGTFTISGSYVSSFGPDITAMPADAVIARAALQKFGQFGTFGPPVFAATHVIDEAIASVCKSGQTPSRSNVLAAIKATNEPSSLLGQPISFDSHGDLNGGKFFLFKIDSAGKYKLIPSS